MSECPACGESEEWDAINESCQACGHYNESKAHGREKRQWEQALRRMEKRHR